MGKEKWCVVSKCLNTTINSPDKIFVAVPSNPVKRTLWLELSRRDPGTISSHSNLYLCEDHFDMENDSINYVEYKKGISQKLFLSNKALPTKFNWLDDSEQNISNDNNICSTDELDVTMDPDFNIMEVCSACLSKNPSFRLINTSADAYTNITGIELTDDLPNQMCNSCIKLLKQADDFRTKCIESYEWLIKARRKINSQIAKKQIELETDINNLIIKEEVILEDETILPDRNKVAEIDIPNTNIKQEIVVEEEMILPEVKAGNEQLFTIKIEELDSHMKDHTYGVKDLDSMENQQISLNQNSNSLKEDIKIPSKLTSTEIIHANIIKEKLLRNKITAAQIYKCDMCNYKTSEERYFVCHKRTHAIRTQFKNVKVYTNRKRNLNVNASSDQSSPKSDSNLKVNAGERPVKCDICDSEFINIHDFGKHTCKKTYNCVLCNKYYIDDYTLKEHIRIQHIIRKQYKCDMCIRSYSQKSSLTKHKRCFVH